MGELILGCFQMTTLLIDILSSGGVRGIVELEILRLIEQVWGGHMRIQDFFDLIVGTRFFFPSI